MANALSGFVSMKNALTACAAGQSMDGLKMVTQDESVGLMNLQIRENCVVGTAGPKIVSLLRELHLFRANG